VPPYFVVYAFTVPPAGFRLISMSRAAKSGQYAAFRALVHAGGTPHASDYYDLCGRGYRSVLMLDERYFLALTSPALTESRASLNTMLPLLKSMPSGTRALGFASLHPKGEQHLFMMLPALVPPASLTSQSGTVHRSTWKAVPGEPH
jgi:hypothetical protein